MSVVSGIQDPAIEKRLQQNDDLPGSFPGPIVRPPSMGPAELERAARRLQFPPSYIVVGIYRLMTDKSLSKPAWDKCKHGTQRGLTVGFAWSCSLSTLPGSLASLMIHFLDAKSRLASQHAHAAVISLGSQVTFILSFFLYRNIRIARERAWAQTVASRGKGPDFWQPYVEEWEFPPYVDESRSGVVLKAFETSIGRFIVKKMILFPISLYPFIGVFVSAYFKALGTARYLHKPYFESKKMTSHQVAVFMEERKWDYRIFGFAAALLEGLPVIGLLFTLSNRIGAAMWAHDLEKRQHFVAAERLRDRHPSGSDAHPQTL